MHYVCLLCAFLARSEAIEGDFHGSYPMLQWAACGQPVKTCDSKHDRYGIFSADSTEISSRNQTNNLYLGSGRCSSWSSKSLQIGGGRIVPAKQRGLLVVNCGTIRVVPFVVVSASRHLRLQTRSKARPIFLAKKPAPVKNTL